MVKHIDRQVDRLKQDILSLGGVVEESLAQAVSAVLERDVSVARAVITADAAVDQKEVEIEEDCLKILALYQPVATDLRFVVSVLKLNNDLERIGDLAVNIAEQAVALSSADPSARPERLAEMVDRVRKMLKASLDSLVNLDPDAARDVCAADDAVDDIHRESYQWLIRSMKANPEQANEHVHYLSVSRYLERIADHATNIAEDVIYMTEGDIIRHKSSS